MFASLLTVPQLQTIMGLLSARLPQNAHQETKAFMFCSHWKVSELFKRLSEVLIQAEINTITQITHEGIVYIFNRSVP